MDYLGGTLYLVVPKGVTRFIVPLLNRSASDESKVLDLIERNYPKMGVMAKSEMTYWLGRIKSPSISERVEQMLLRFYEEQKKNYPACRLRTTDTNRPVLAECQCRKVLLLGVYGKNREQYLLEGNRIIRVCIADTSGSISRAVRREQDRYVGLVHKPCIRGRAVK